MMKKTLILNLVAAAAIMASCTKVQVGDGIYQDQNQYQYLYGRIDTKCTIADDDRTIQWEIGDSIIVYGNDSEKARYYIATEDDAASGKLTFKRMMSGEHLTGITKAEKFPAIWQDIANQTYIDGKFPAILTGVPDSEDATRLIFSNGYQGTEWAYVKLVLEGDATISKLVVASDAGVLNTSGKITVKMKDNALALDGGSKKVYFITKEVTEPADVTFTIYDDKGASLSRKVSSVTLAANCVSRFPAIACYSYPESGTIAKAVVENVSGVKKEVIWAPKYCGYSVAHPNGLLYQFGRTAGQPYYPAAPTGTGTVCKDGPVSDPEDGYFYKKDGGDWYKGTALTAWPQKASDAGYVAGKIGNPCPSGWRVPTEAEFKGLMEIGFTQSTSWSFSAGSGNDASMEAVAVTTGFTLKDGSGLFFAAVGGRTSKGQSFYRGSGSGAYARCWADGTDGTDTTKGKYLKLSRSGSSNAADGFVCETASSVKASGYSVRCVKE